MKGGATLGQRAVTEASHHAGQPYVYGAEGPSAFDCSGFTKYVWARVGRSLPRTSAEQRAATAWVPNSQKQPGDLIFFALGGGGVDHVGIYAGNDHMWIAPKTGDVVKYQAIWTPAYTVGRV